MILNHRFGMQVDLSLAQMIKYLQLQTLSLIYHWLVRDQIFHRAFHAQWDLIGKELPQNMVLL